MPAYRAKTPPKATAQVRFDEGNLYVATVCPWNKPTQVEVFLQAIKEDKPGEALVLRGDSSGKVEAAGKAVTYAVSGGDGRWTMEWRIPFALNATTKTRFNVRVRQEGDRDWIAWAASDPGYLVCEPPVPADAKNLAANGDFEAGTDKPNAWSVVERITGELPAGAKKAVGLWVNQGREGSRCLKLEAADPNAMKVCETWWAQSFPAPPAGTYIMSYEIRARDIVPRREDGKVYASGWAQWKKDGQTQGMNLGWGPENHITRGSAPCWTRRESVFNVSGQAETIYLLFGIEHATGTVWIDNVRLEKCQ